VRVFAGAAALCLAFLAESIVGSTRSAAASAWGGSIGLTSDYMVRGISRTDDQPALQLDLHYAHSSGFLAGFFESNTRIEGNEPRDVELSGFIGWGWNISPDWNTKVVLSHYAYPWNRRGSRYDYDELDLDVAYQGWLHLNLEYSPNSPRFLPHPYFALIGENQKSAEISLQRPIWRKLSLTAGVGYSFLDGAESEGYTYWSAGAAYDIRSVSLVFAYVNTSDAAKVLFPNAASSNRWTGTVIWRF
jgi:uncharacterized protein (TIGR02001 family)